MPSPEKIKKSKKSILLIIDEIEDNKGLGNGCNIEISKRVVRDYGDVTIITQPHNVALLKDDSCFKNTPLIGVGAPIASHYLWNICVGKYVKRLVENRSFDVIHMMGVHANCGPHFLPKTGAKLIWGPIVHHATSVDSIIVGHKVTQFIERSKVFLSRLGRSYLRCICPFMRRAIKRSDVVIVGNLNESVLFEKHAKKMEEFPCFGSRFEGKNNKQIGNQFDVVFVGRLANLNGAMAALDAFAKFDKEYYHHAVKATLTYVGSGPLQQVLAKKIKAYGLEKQVTLLEEMPSQERNKWCEKAHLLLFPGFESQEATVSEAMSFATPVLCFDQSGVSFTAGDTARCVNVTSYDETIDHLSRELTDIFMDFVGEYQNDHSRYSQWVEQTLARYKKHLHWDAIYTKIVAHYA